MCCCIRGELSIVLAFAYSRANALPRRLTAAPIFGASGPSLESNRNKSHGANGDLGHIQP